MQASEILFDGAYVQALTYRSDSPYTLISFESLGGVANGKRAFALELAKKNNIDLIGFVAKGRNWYPACEMDAAVKAVVSHIDRPSVTYGSSMGGYAALRYSRALGAQSTLAFGPQFSIDPAVIGQADRRFHGYFDASLHRDMLIEPNHLCRQSHAFYDPHTLTDRAQMNLMPDNINLSKIPLFHTGHELISVMASSDASTRVFSAAIRGDRKTILRTLLDRRKRLTSYHLHLSETSQKLNHISWSRSIAKRGYDLNPADWKMARRYTKVLSHFGEHDEALRLFKHTSQQNPAHPNVQTHYAQLLLSANRLDDAISHLEETIRKKDHTLLWYSLLDCLTRTGDHARLVAAFRLARAAHPNSAALDRKYEHLLDD